MNHARQSVARTHPPQSPKANPADPEDPAQPYVIQIRPGSTAPASTLRRERAKAARKARQVDIAADLSSLFREMGRSQEQVAIRAGVTRATLSECLRGDGLACINAAVLESDRELAIRFYQLRLTKLVGGRPVVAAPKGHRAK